MSIRARHFRVELATERPDLVDSAQPSEHHLLEVKKEYPQLTPTHDVGQNGDHLVLGPDTTIASESVESA